MSVRFARMSHGLQHLLLSCASLLVPGRQRIDWRREWRSELWHVREATTPKQGMDWHAEREVVAFCLGAFQDAVYLRREPGVRCVAFATTAGSPVHCMTYLLGLVIASYGVGLVLPGVRAAVHTSPDRNKENLVLIQDVPYGDNPVTTIGSEQFKMWTKRRQSLFDGFAFYRVDTEMMSGDLHTTAGASVARGSLNLLTLLDIPIRSTAQEDEGKTLPGVILSDEMWRRNFGEDAQILGRVVYLAGQKIRVLGVVPSDSWRLSEKVDAWLLEPDSRIAPGTRGSVIARVRPSAEHGRFENRWPMSVPRVDGGADDFICISLAEPSSSPSGVFLFTVFLACLALPATTSLPLGEYRVNAHSPSWSTRLRRWSFLASKIVLLLPMVYFMSFDVAHLRSAFEPVTSEYIQIVSSFCICLFGLRWILRDQRRRCPVCLGRLSHPARVGEPSRNFLGWNGMELICVSGHGLLHVPEIQTSWFRTQRWLYLDPSWDVLFADSTLISAP